MAKPKLKIIVKPDGEKEFLLQFRKGRNILVTGRAYNRRANARKTRDSIIRDIQSGNYEFIEEK